jgi:SAM-dependent methyltransferase
MEEPVQGKDPWLQRWLPLIATRAGSLPILELGCGAGRDSAVLAGQGHAIVGLDISSEAIARARLRVPSARFFVQDLRAPFPVPGPFGVVIASLSLHYFAWEETVRLAELIHDSLLPGGVLVCRLNSTNDVHYGATGHPRVAENYFLVDGQHKRFFDRAAVERLFSRGWTMLGLEEKTVHRYEHPKMLWEAGLERR